MGWQSFNTLHLISCFRFGADWCSRLSSDNSYISVVVGERFAPEETFNQKRSGTVYNFLFYAITDDFSALLARELLSEEDNQGVPQGYGRGH